VPRRTAPSEPALPSRLAPALLAWFRREQRPLPWRVARDPYRTWVAEVLLQQTRVEQAVPYFERFIGRFPDLRALAAAPPSEVLKTWQGAGYYSRAVRLHAAARALVTRHGGMLPRTVEELERLPGIGPYIARAIAAIAFDVPVVPADANVFRVVARWTREARSLGSAPVRASLVRRLEMLAPRRRSGEFAEALMELGETICRPRRPRCDECPVAFGCRAWRELRDPATVPRRPGRPPRRRVRAAVAAIRCGERWLVQRRPTSGFLGGLWEFPGGKIERGESPRAAARRELREETGLVAGPLEAVATVRHDYSHMSVELHAFRGTVRRAVPVGGPRRWATLEEVARLPLPKATERILGLLRSDPPAWKRADGPWSASPLRPAVLKRRRAPPTRAAPRGSPRPGHVRRTGGRASRERRGLPPPGAATPGRGEGG